MRSHLTYLPPEVLSTVFSYLRPRALRQCLLVNSAFNTLVRPHLFRYIAAFGDEAEPCFFLLHDNSFLEALAVIGDIDEDQPIPKDLSYMCLFAHAHCCNREREPFSSPTGSPFISSCRVLNVHLALPDDEDNISSAHADYFNPGWRLVDRPLEGPYLQPLQCHILHHALEDARVDKLVLRNVPVIYGNVDPDLLPPSAAETVKEAVLVLNVDSMNEANRSLVEDYLAESFDCFEEEHDGIESVRPCMEPGELERPEIGSLASAVPPNVEDLTLVFWTPRPRTDATPTCCMPVPLCEECETKDSEDTSDAEKQPSCWQEKFWNDLADTVAPRLIHQLGAVTIVNASAIVPAGAVREQYVRPISTGVATHTTFEKKYCNILSSRLTGEYGVQSGRVKEYVDRVHFEYMSDWLLSTEWEDVFEWSEVKPWLQFKRPALITDYFKPVDPDTVKWRKDMNPTERISLRHKRSTMKRTKPNKYTWNH
ncbi:hypothetical protein A1Q2_00907 [Trichosporon asahii var. asahii CBS 8904]|uniref:F-box domain-containing protein n=1 Tax=Trichosporon asahii var. asahii (strain CBS 8904) TaxID=1220162 RepID=K1VW47_TRIAC|nr:hypothetical protein A1Q2_00907 [Trichosporon asahii var. asahii CBS 8904]